MALASSPSRRDELRAREINPSPEVLDALARALRLEPAERRTLFALARTELPLADDVTGTAPGQLDGDIGELIALVDSMHPNPAYLLGPMTRILAWNGPAGAADGRLRAGRCGDSGGARDPLSSDRFARAHRGQSWAAGSGSPSWVALSSSARSCSPSSTSAAAMFSSRCRTELVPGISSIRS